MQEKTQTCACEDVKWGWILNYVPIHIHTMIPSNYVFAYSYVLLKVQLQSITTNMFSKSPYLQGLSRLYRNLFYSYKILEC